MYAIKHDNGTYYAGPSGIGPRFGATSKDAVRFKSKRAANETMRKHWAFAEGNAIRCLWVDDSTRVVPDEACKAPVDAVEAFARWLS